MLGALLCVGRALSWTYFTPEESHQECKEFSATGLFIDRKTEESLIRKIRKMNKKHEQKKNHLFLCSCHLLWRLPYPDSEKVLKQRNLHLDNCSVDGEKTVSSFCHYSTIKHKHYHAHSGIGKK
jgi:hypothetical protein